MIVQTNSAGDNVHVIDPVTNKVMGVINGIEVSHGAAVAPDGTRIYVSNEADSTLDFVDGKSLKVVKKVPLSGHPNNIAVGKDGRRVYVGIIQAPGGVDVIDTASMKNVNDGDERARFTTPRHTRRQVVVAGSIAGGQSSSTRRRNKPAWVLDMDLDPADGVCRQRRRIDEVDLRPAHRPQRFAIVDFATRKGDQAHSESRSAARARDGSRDRIRRTGWRSRPTARRWSSASRLNNYLYSYAA